MEGFPRAELRAAFVWLPMLPGDGGAAATWAASGIRDPRAEHFHDPRRRAGAAFAATLGIARAVPFAWDVFMLFDGAARWGDSPPEPAAWFHQLGASVEGLLGSGRA